METMFLQFQASGNARLLLMLLAAISLVLAAVGAKKLLERKWRDGSLCLAAALGPPGIVSAFILDAVFRFSSGNAKGGRVSVLAAGAIAGGTALGITLAVATGFDATAIWMAGVGIHAATAVGIFYANVFARLGTGRIAVLMALRCLAILALLLILFKPALSIVPPADQFRPTLPILVDRSASMSTVDDATLGERYMQALQMINAQRTKIEKSFRPVFYSFARGVAMADSYQSMLNLHPAGENTDATNLALAIKSIGSQYDANSIPGMILVSDGNHNTADNPADAALEYGTAVYTVGVGSASETAQGRKNIQLLSVEAPLEAVKNNVSTITAAVKMVGFATTNADVRLLEEGVAQPLDTQPLWTNKNIDTLTVKLKWTPKDAGDEGAKNRVRRLRVVVPPNPLETVKEDNAADLHTLVVEPRIRVLYVEGSIRPEYKYLKRMLDTDPNIQFMSLVRIAENRFWAQGAANGMTIDHLPVSDADFKLFDVLILGSLDRSFLTNEQMTRIRKFVNDGGGLLMLGGLNSFGPGGYEGTDLEQVLPVFMGPRSMPQESTPFLPQLTAEGEVHPIFEHVSEYLLGPGGRKPKADATALPELRGCVTVRGAKSGASKLALHPTRSNENGPLIVLAVQPFGAGRSAAFTPDTTWQWYLPLKGLGAESPYQRLWAQMIRWLANAETKSRQQAASVLLRTDTAYLQLGQTLNLLARVQDEKGQAPQSGQVSCQVTALDAPAAPAQTIPLAAKAGLGMFEGQFRATNKGPYRLKVTAVDGSGKTIGSDELIVTVAPHTSELDRLSRNADLLRKLADVSGGRYADIAGLPELIDQVIDRQKARSAPPPETKNYHLYNFTLLFVVFVVLITGEWLLRRRWQLN